MKVSLSDDDLKQEQIKQDEMPKEEKPSEEEKSFDNNTSALGPESGETEAESSSDEDKKQALTEAVNSFNLMARNGGWVFEGKQINSFNDMSDEFKAKFIENPPKTIREMNDILQEFDIKTASGAPVNQEVIRTTVGEIVGTMVGSAIAAPFKAIAAMGRTLLGEGQLTPAHAQLVSDEAQKMMEDIPSNAAEMTAMQEAGVRENIATIASRTAEAIQSNDIEAFTDIKQDFLRLTEAAKQTGDEDLYEKLSGFASVINETKDDVKLRESLEDSLDEESAEKMMKAIEDLAESMKSMLDKIKSFFTGPKGDLSTDNDDGQEQQMSSAPA